MSEATSHDSQQPLPEQRATELEVQATREALVAVVEQFEQFKEYTRDATLLTDERLADTQLLQGEGIPVDPRLLIDGVNSIFTPLARGVTQLGHSVTMDDLLPTDGSQRAETIRYTLGGDVSLLVDAMSRVDDGEPTWVRVTALREPSAR